MKARSSLLKMNKHKSLMRIHICQAKIFSFVLVFLLSSCGNKGDNNTIGLKENIHHDDFEYSVTSVLRKSFLEVPQDSNLKIDTIFYLVRFKVENRALRVNHKWDNSIGFIVDETGKKYENSVDNQIILDKSLHFGWKADYNTPAGASDSTMLVFKLPVTAVKPGLMVRGETLMGDVFDRGRFRKMKIRLY